MKYPTGIKKENIFHKIDYGNRGMKLESDLNVTNSYYRDNNKAFIYKKPTPIKIVDVSYESRSAAEITKAFFTEPSTTDYNGIYKGRYIDFEAKETKSRTSFPLSNIHKHQIKHLDMIYNHGGIGFLIVRFTTINKTFLLTYEALKGFIENNDRKSIPLSYFLDNGYLIKDKYNPRVDYIEVIDKLYFGGMP